MKKKIVARLQTLTHEASGVGLVGADLAVDLDEALLEDSSNLLAGKSVLETVTEEDGQGKRLAELVGTGRGAGSVGAAELVEEPRRGSCKALEVLLRTATLFMLAASLHGKFLPSKFWFRRVETKKSTRVAERDGIDISQPDRCCRRDGHRVDDSPLHLCKGVFQVPAQTTKDITSSSWPSCCPSTPAHSQLSCALRVLFLVVAAVVVAIAWGRAGCSPF